MLAKSAAKDHPWCRLSCFTGALRHVHLHFSDTAAMKSARLGGALLRATNLPAFLALLVIITGWAAAETQARKSHIAAQRAEIAAMVGVLRVDLEGAVNGPIQLVRGLIAVIATEPNMDQDRFADLANRMIYYEPSLRNIAAAPDMVIRLMYPVAGNEQAIGLDYRLLPDQRDGALRARDTGDLVLAGPVDLVQGGQGFVGRFPVFLRAEQGPPAFWGLVSVVIDIDELYGEVGLNSALPFALSLTGQDATGPAGQRFFGPEISAADDPVITNVILPTGDWQIAAIPFGGWNTDHPQIWSIRLSLLFAAALILVPSIGMGLSMEQRLKAITDLETANTALQHQMHALETARARQTEAEVQLRQSQKLEAVGQLTGGVAHDFNNLLTIILGNAEILAEALEDDTRLRKLAQVTVKAAERGADLTSSLLAFSRKQPLNPKVLNINCQIYDGVELLLRRTLPESIRLQIRQGENLWPIKVDPSQLEAALLNIVINARDAMPEGGKIRIATGNLTLNNQTRPAIPDLPSGDYVTICVTDTGAGMQAETLSRVFEPFFTTKDVGSGTGLGLSVVYGFMKQTGGHISLQSAPDKGTEVTLYFPRAQEDPVTPREITRQPNIAHGHETVLVVEDDAQVRAQVCANLTGLGYAVQAAENGPDALALLAQAGPVDLLFTDIILPGGMNGRVLAEKARELRPDLKILFTSGYSNDPIIDRHGSDPDLPILAKPYRRSQLAAKLRQVLDADTPLTGG
jgi:sensor domain CHASE-containing protein/nitrogen-specific signal transduction histidine kinase